MDFKLQKLKEFGAGGFEHVDGTLWDHLLGTRDILADWGASTMLQDAGLFHACYSTAGFGEQLVELEQRNRIIEVIGEQAENIVYHYCACDRELFYPRFSETTTPKFTNRFNGEDYFLDDALLKDFCELTVANEIEIAVGNDKFIGKHGASRYRIYKAMSGYLSNSAINRVEKIFGLPTL